MSVQERAQKDAFAFSFSFNIPANTKEEDPASKEVQAPYDARFKDPLVTWPGVDAGVGFRLERGDGTKLFPRNDDPEDRFEAMNVAVAATIEMNFPVERGETIRAEYVNYDPVKSRIINILPTYEAV